VAGYSGLLKGGHLGQNPGASLDQRHGQGSAGTFAQAQIKTRMGR